jgi:hypothetical protein
MVPLVPDAEASVTPLFEVQTGVPETDVNKVFE